jgi:hypothetical protein
MATMTVNYAADTALITVTLTSLANASMRAASMIDNTTNKYVDAQLQLKLPVQAGAAPAVGGDKAIYVYFYGGVKPDLLTHPVTGTDSAVAVASAGNLIGPYAVAMTDINVTVETIIPSVATFFGGVLPPYWGPVFYNQMSASLGAEATISYLGIKYDAV